MRRLLLHLLCVAEALFCAAASAELSEDALKQMSAPGRLYVAEEIKSVLLGARNVTEVMRKTEERHKHLMEALRRSCDKKKGVMQLVQETQQKLGEAEQQCGASTPSLFAACRPCLDDTCRASSTSACRRGFAFFSLKVEELSERPADPPGEPELLQADAAFGRLRARARLLRRRGTALLRDARRTLGDPLLTEARELEPRPPQTGGGDPDPDPGPAFDFGRNVVGEGRSRSAEEEREPEEDLQETSRESSTSEPSQSKRLCRRLRRRASECWRLQSLCEACEDDLLRACPGVRRLQSEVEEMDVLMAASRQQVADRLLLVRGHAEVAQGWLRRAADQLEWVGRLLGGGGCSGDVFNVIEVAPRRRADGGPGPGTGVTVALLGSAPLRVRVPAELQLEDPAFVRRVAQEALALFKQQTTRVRPSGTN